jgi:hypothetical protein
LAFAIVTDLFFVFIANNPAFAAVFGIGLSIDAFIAAIGFALFTFDDAFAALTGLAILAFRCAFAAVICANIGIDALVATVDLTNLASRHALRAVVF